jgi:hypothetical protein
VSWKPGDKTSDGVWEENWIECHICKKRFSSKTFNNHPCTVLQSFNPAGYIKDDPRAAAEDYALCPRCWARIPRSEFSAHTCVGKPELNKASQGGGLPSDAKERKTYPIATGVIDYFPKALTELAHVSFVANEQHNPGTPVHWDRAKSPDESDSLMRHFIERGKLDTDGMRHTAKMAWRALALLEKELEAG